MTRDDPKPLDQDVRERLEAEIAAVLAPDDARARVQQRVASTLGLSWGHSGGEAVEPREVPAPSTHAFARARVVPHILSPLVLVALAVSFGLGAVTGALVWRAAHAPPQPQVVYVDRDVSVPLAPASAGDAVVAAPAPSSSPSSLATPPTSLVGSSLGAERALLDVARSAFGRGQGDEALAALARHEKLYPSGQLAEEREALAVRVLVSTQRGDLARARAARFRRLYPRSVMLPAVEAALGSLP
jgi:hypothetical protein